MCCSVYCLCVNVYCTTASGCRPNCSWQIYHIISYHIISHHITSYHIISYHIISYHITYHITSYHIISHHIISYHIISHHIISHHIIYVLRVTTDFVARGLEDATWMLNRFWIVSNSRLLPDVSNISYIISHHIISHHIISHHIIYHIIFLIHFSIVPCLAKLKPFYFTFKRKRSTAQSPR